MDKGEGFEAAAAEVAGGCCELRTPDMALRVFGVIVAATFDRDDPEELLIIARKAAVPGLGGGNETGPPMSGVSPEPGVNPVRGVRPVLKDDGSKGAEAAERGWW